MSDDQTLRMERVFAATPEQLFDAWTKADQLVRWWGPEGVTIPRHELDIREGGVCNRLFELVLVHFGVVRFSMGGMPGII